MRAVGGHRRGGGHHEARGGLGCIMRAVGARSPLEWLWAGSEGYQGPKDGGQGWDH